MYNGYGILEVLVVDLIGFRRDGGAVLVDGAGGGGGLFLGHGLDSGGDLDCLLLLALGDALIVALSGGSGLLLDNLRLLNGCGAVRVTPHAGLALLLRGVAVIEKKIKVR